VRPSNSERFINCNMSLRTPVVEKTKQQLKYLQERSDDHSRLFKGEFKESERSCMATYLHIMDACKGHIYKETLLVRGDFKGTPDIFGYDEDRSLLYIMDYKTGFYKVDAMENMQLISYAYLITKNKEKFDWKISSMDFVILNTQSDYVSQCTVAQDALLDKFADLEWAIENHSKEDRLYYGRKGLWCRFCPSKKNCGIYGEVQGENV